MRIRPTRLHVKNCCQHRERDLEIPVGTIGITGPNGAGKSNLAKLMYVGLTGEPQTGTRSSLLNWESSFGYIEEWFDHQGTEIYVKRDIAKGTHLLRSTALKDDLTKKETVNKYLSDIIGLDVTRLSKVSFIPQGQLTQFLRMTHGERSKLFYTLFGMEQAERISAAILQRRLKIAVPTDNTSRISGISKELEILDVQRKAAEVELHNIKGLLMSQSDIYKKAQLDSVKEVDADIGARLQSLNTDLMDLLGKMETMRKSAESDKLSVTLGEVEAMWKTSQDKIAQEKIVSAFEALILDLNTREGALVVPGCLPDTSSAKEEMDIAVNKHAVCCSGLCHTCHAEYHVSPEVLASLEDKAIEARRKYEILCKEHNRISREFDAYRDAKIAIRSDRQSYQKMIANAEAELTKLKDAPVISEEDYKAFKGMIETRNRREEELKTLQVRMSSLDLAIQACSGASVVPKDIKEKAQQVVTAYEGMRDQLGKFGTAWAEADTRYRLMKATLDTLSEEQSRYSSTSGTLNILDRGREVMHPDCLPRRTAQSLVKDFNTRLIEYEAVFGYRFTCRLNQDLDFEVSFPEKAGLSVEVLSGGQEMAASVAALMTLHSMLASNFGMLVLDEPTYGLDTDNLAALTQVLSKACGHLQSKGMTVLIPTHEVSLFPIFTQTLTL